MNQRMLLEKYNKELEEQKKAHLKLEGQVKVLKIEKGGEVRQLRSEVEELKTQNHEHKLENAVLQEKIFRAKKMLEQKRPEYRRVPHYDYY